MKTRLLILSLAVLCLGAVPAMANVTFGDGAVALQGVLDGITVTPPSSVTALTDEIGDDYDSAWGIDGSGGSLSTVVIELAGFAGSNKFGIYDPTNTSVFKELFDGSATTGSQVTLSITALGDVFVNHVDTGVDLSGTKFGYYLDATVGNGNPQAIFYSDTQYNADGVDHMAAYQGTGDMVQIGVWGAGAWTANEYILAFEDLYNGGDRDFTDFVVMVESVTPVPVPAAFLLGMLGLSAAGLKLRKHA